MSLNGKDRRIYNKWKRAVILMLITAWMLSACSTASEPAEIPEPGADEGPAIQEMQETVDAPESAGEGSAETVTENPLLEDPVYAAADPAAVGANELGQVMVLMYHHVREPEAEWSRTPENFRRDLEVLYEAGYRPIRLIDYARGYINVPAGTSPVVLTFDDGNENKFRMIQDDTGEWVIDPDCAVGILTAFYEEHSDFRPHATFFINGGTPFGQSDWLDFKLNFLVEHGMDIGNHTETHLHLGDVTPERLQQELARVQMLVTRYVADYPVNTFALPFGSRPRDELTALFVISGEFEGVSYHNEAVLEVGWDPYHSPHHRDFDPHRIRRVRASETNVDGVGMYNWLAAFESGSRPRYISDGNPDTIAIPRNREEFLAEDTGGRRVIMYDPQ